MIPLPFPALPALAAFAATLLVAAPFAGCTEAPTGSLDGREALAALSWPTLRVHTTPSEPFESTGPIQVTWSGALFAVWAAVEPDLNRRSVVEGGEVYTNDQSGMGWTRQGLDEGMRSSRLSNRLALWNLPALLADPAFTVEGERSGAATNLTAAGKLQVGGRSMEVRVEVGAVGNEVVWVRETSQQARESPYTFRKDPEPFPFPVVRPANAMTTGEAAEGNLRAQSDHTFVVQMLRDHAFRSGGAVPDEPSPSSLAVELLASGKPWPRNAFTGASLAVGHGSGDIGWRKCGANDGAYTGWGWDSAVVFQSFGGGCPS